MIRDIRKMKQDFDMGIVIDDESWNVWKVEGEAKNRFRLAIEDHAFDHLVDTGRYTMMIPFDKVETSFGRFMVLKNFAGHEVANFEEGDLPEKIGHILYHIKEIY